MEKDKGTYILIVEISKPIKVKVGSLGLVDFKKGIYAYIGSAMNSLNKRIKRHAKKQKKIHWHLDYLTSLPEVEVKKAYVFFNKRIEEKLSTDFAKKYKGVKKFGASDMKKVSSNFYVVDDEVEKFIVSLGGVSFEKIFSSHG